MQVQFVCVSVSIHHLLSTLAYLLTAGLIINTTLIAHCEAKHSCKSLSAIFYIWKTAQFFQGINPSCLWTRFLIPVLFDNALWKSKVQQPSFLWPTPSWGVVIHCQVGRSCLKEIRRPPLSPSSHWGRSSLPEVVKERRKKKSSEWILSGGKAWLRCRAEQNMNLSLSTERNGVTLDTRPVCS